MKHVLKESIIFVTKNNFCNAYIYQVLKHEILSDTKEV
jgi:hypothetical protein